MPFALWCHACAHEMHTTAHGTRHRRLCKDIHGFLCSCCGETFKWRALTTHLNQAGAHLRLPRWHVAPLPMTDRPNRSCRQMEQENRGRFHPYTQSPPSSASSPASYRQRDPMWSSTTVSPPVTQSVHFAQGTGFRSPPPFSPGGLLTDLAVTSSPDTISTWTDCIPSASWSTLGVETSLPSLGDTDEEAPSSVQSTASSQPREPRRTPSMASSSVILESSSSVAPPGYATDTPPLAAVRTLAASQVDLTEAELNAVLISHVIWLADIVRTHVPHLPPDDLANKAGRRLMQARGQWLVSVPNPGFLDKIDNVSGSNVIKKVLH